VFNLRTQGVVVFGAASLAETGMGICYAPWQTKKDWRLSRVRHVAELLLLSRGNIRFGRGNAKELRLDDD
jgi:hypothetical protein